MIELVIITFISIKSCNHSRKCEILVYTHISRSELTDFVTGFREPVLCIENRRLIHIIPESLNAKLCKNGIFFSEPFSCFRLQKIRKMYQSRPYRTNKIYALSIFAEIIILQALLIDVVAVLYLNSCVNYGNKAYPLFFHIAHKLFKFGETLLVNGKILVTFHIVNIKIDTVKGYARSLVLLRNAADILLVFVSPTALSIAECP